MKLKPVIAAITAVLSTGAYAAAGSAQQQHPPQAAQDRPMSQSQSMQPPQHERSEAQKQERTGQAQASDTVRKAQQALKDKGFDAGPVDGIMGPKTQQAVKNFQESQTKLKAKATGKLDQQTLSALGVEGEAMGTAPGKQRAPAAGGPSAGEPGGAAQKKDQQRSR